MILPVSSIYKTDLKKQPNQKGTAQKEKPEMGFQDILDKELAGGLSSKTSMRNETQDMDLLFPKNSKFPCFFSVPLIKNQF